MLYLFCIENRSLFFTYDRFTLYYAYIGFLDLSSESEDLKPGAKLELPLWLAQPLNKVRESIVSIDIPKTYKEGYRFVLVCICTCSRINFY